MFSAGLVEETHGLIDRGHGAALERLRAIGYDEAMALLRGDIDRAGAEARTSLRTLQLAKRQRTWFRHQIDAVCVDGGESAMESLRRAIAGGG
jgi:tRNA dimethylallyltransferase